MLVEKKLYLWLKSQREYFKAIRKERDNYNWDKDNITLNNKWGNKMTRKDYIKIARIISKARICKNTLDSNELISDLCIVLKEDNSLFDRQRFINACE